MDVIAKLNKLRLERNLSVYRLSELTGINQSTLANTFSRGTVPSIQNLEIICSTLGLTLSQFFQEDEKEIILNENDLSFFNEYKKLPADMQVTVVDLIKKINNNNSL